MQNTIFGPDQTDPILSEASAYGYALAMLHQRIMVACRPQGAWDFGPSFAEADLHYYIHWAISAYLTLQDRTEALRSQAQDARTPPYSLGVL
jgi:hypothetical protein